MPDEPKPYLIVFLILVCALLVFAVSIRFINALLFIPVSFLVIVFAGLVYGRKALWFALFLGIFLLVSTYLFIGTITVESLSIAGVFCMVAFFAGMVVEQKKRILEENLRTNEQLKKITEDNLVYQAELKAVQIVSDSANRKLTFLSGIVQHDILNNLSALIGSVDLLKTKISEPELLEDLNRSEKIAHAIQRQIEFARTYEMIGTSAPQWINVDTQVQGLLSSLPGNEMSFSISLKGLEIFVDPLFDKVFANLINNSLIHGVRVSHISVSYLPYNEGIAIVYTDDGIGIHAVDKSQIFEKGLGKNPGFGLFLSREILSITKLSVKECGVYGEGARFEIFVPEGKYRFI